MRLYPGVKKLLNGLKSQGYKLGIVTNKGRFFEFEGKRVGCVNELEDVGILQFFDTVVGFEDVTDEKPHPEGIRLALRKLGTKPQETLMVGDSAADIAAARAAGCVSCRATWGLAVDAVEDKTPAADYVAAVPADVIRIFDGRK